MQSICTLKRIFFFILFCVTASKINAQSITACTPPVIISHPVSVNWDCNGNAVFSVNASGPGLTYQWQSMHPLIITPWNNIYDGTVYGGTSTSTLTVHAINSANNGYVYRVIINNACGNVLSNTVSLTTNPLTLDVSTQYIDACSQALVPVHITTEVNGVPAAGVWAPVTNLYMDVAGTLPYNGSSTNIVYVDPNNFPSSNILVNATIGNCTLYRSIQVVPNVNPPYIYYQSRDAYVCEGADNTFSVVAYYISPLSYQWQVSTTGCGGTFNDIPGATNDQYPVTAITASQDGSAFRCIVANACGNKDTSDCAALHVVTAPEITVQPVDAFACEGTYANFYSRSNHVGFTIKWQVSTNGGATFSDITGANFYYYSVQASAAINGNLYRAVFSGPNCTTATTSSPAMLHINITPNIIIQPVPATVCPGDSALLFVNTNQAQPGFQWQLSTDGGATFTDMPGATNDTLIIAPVTSGMNLNLYRVIVTGENCIGPTVSVDVTLTVGTAVNITTAPADAAGCVGNPITFNSVATGQNLTYQWQVSTDAGATFNNIPGATASIYATDPVTISMDQYQYRVIVTGTATGTCSGTDTSNAATLTVLVNINPVITSQPQSAGICAGTSTTLSIVAGPGIIFYQWEVSVNGCNGPWANLAAVPGPDIPTGILTVTHYYRCRIWSPCSTGYIYSDCATVTVNGSIDITTVPADQTICAGSDAVFSVASSTPGVTYQWEVSFSPGIFTAIPGATGATYTITSAPSTFDGVEYRVIVSSSSCAIPFISQPAVLTVNEHPFITSTATHVSTCLGNTTTFNVSAVGTNLAYQWQVSTDMGVTYSIIPGATSATYITDPVTASMDWNLYQVVVTGTCSVITSDADSLTVATPVAIVTQPADVSTCVGMGVMFVIDFTGQLAWAQWQVSTTGCSGNFVDIPGANFYNLTLPGVSASQDGYAYRCKLTSTCGGSIIISNCATLTVGNNMITSAPANQPVCSGGSATFTVGVSGTSNTYQWQESLDAGISYQDIPGATNAAFTIPFVDGSLNYILYQVVVSNNSCAPMTSNPVELNIAGSTGIIGQPQAVAVCEDSSVWFTARMDNTVSNYAGLTYVWQVSTDNGITFTDVPTAPDDETLSLSPIDNNMNGNLYRCIITSAAPCPATFISDNALLTVHPFPSITATASESSVCNGSVVTLTAGGAGANGVYDWPQWGPGSSLQLGVYTDSNNPNSPYTNIYTVYGTDVYGCSGTSTVSVIAHPYPIVNMSINPFNSSLSPAQPVVLTAWATLPSTYSYIWRKDLSVIPGANAVSHTVHFGEPGAYDVIATSQAGCADTSWSITLMDSVIQRMYVYSNPNTGRFNINYPDVPENASVSIFNSQGHRVYRKTNVETAVPVYVDMGNVLSGIYLVILYDKNGKAIFKEKMLIHH